ncbi:MATE family efflux transporter [Caldalkalibacillus mannanilyticus]|uniref:MATE family efflux transporter n=1 Tax=Caldalkalibacillus mannanilyticus TaxID=1418 RepID=UPI000AC97600|nr:MATE family efflux transporter [Caldalkalibacillus mannanilyticus]
MNHSLGREFNFRSLLSFAFPTMIMMIFTSMYTIVDGLIVSRFIGTDALSAINIVFPAIIITIAIGVMLGTGGSAIIARKLGENKIQEAKEAFTLIVLVGVVISIIIGMIFILFLEPICQLLGASDLLLEHCKQYLYTLSFFIPALMLQMLFEIFFITAGKPKLGLILIVFAGITNGVLDYVFIVSMNMGITGAALATAIGCLIPSIGGLIYFFNHKNSLHFVRPSLKKNVIWASCLNGSSEMVTNLSAGIITWIFNLLMMKHLGENGVAAMTIVLYTQFLMTALFMGFSMGVAPVFSYNYGRQHHVQLKRLFQICIRFIGGARF